RVQGALRERREGANLLDLVSPELHPERLAPGRREDVHQAATNGELPALVGTLDALVAGQREGLRQRLQADFFARPDPHGLGSRLLRRHGLGERGSRGADETAGGKDVERTRALTDEVRRRIEA